jgi:hypothetical protein
MSDLKGRHFEGAMAEFGGCGGRRRILGDVRRRAGDTPWRRIPLLPCRGQDRASRAIRCWPCCARAPAGAHRHHARRQEGVARIVRHGRCVVFHSWPRWRRHAPCSPRSCVGGHLRGPPIAAACPEWTLARPEPRGERCAEVDQRHASSLGRLRQGSSSSLRLAFAAKHASRLTEGRRGSSFAGADRAYQGNIGQTVFVMRRPPIRSGCPATRRA